MRPHPMSVLAGLTIACMAVPAFADWRAPREALPNRSQQGAISVYYTPLGEHAVAPDVVAAMHRQLDEATRFFEGPLGLLPPQRTSRYRGELVGIDVHVMKMSNSRGSAGDAAVQYRYRAFARQPGAVLTLTIDSQWQPPNLTPAHELFHAYQYGYTFFKNGWFLEGMARALEFSMETGPAARADQPLPASAAQWEAVTARSYGAHTLWRRLMHLCEPGCRAPSAPFARPCGAALIRSTLEAFDEADAAVGDARGLDPHDWPEHEQRSPANTLPMARALHRAVDRACPAPHEPELHRFQQVLETVVNGPARDMPRPQR